MVSDLRGKQDDCSYYCVLFIRAFSPDYVPWYYQSAALKSTASSQNQPWQAMRHAVMYETSPETIEMSAKASVCPRQAWQSCGKRLELERKCISLFFLFSYLSRLPSPSLRSIYWCTLCVTFGLAYSFLINIYTGQLGSCSCKLNIVTQVHHQAFCFIKQPPDAYGNI